MCLLAKSGADMAGLAWEGGRLICYWGQFATGGLSVLDRETTNGGEIAAKSGSSV